MKLSVIQNQKQFTKDLPGLPPELTEQIPNLRDDSEIRAKNDEIAKHEGTLTELRKKRDNYRHPYPAGVSVPSAHADAEQLRAGVPVDQLPGRPPADELAELNRQINGEEELIRMLKDERNVGIYGRAITRACNNLPEECEGIFQAILMRAEALQTAIEAALQLDAAMARAGLESTRRPARLTVIQHWKDFLFGANRWPSVSWILDQQKKLWEGGK